MGRDDGFAVQSMNSGRATHNFNGLSLRHEFDFAIMPQPPSPTLTNPDMILPSFMDSSRAYTPSPPRGSQTPSPAATPPGLGRPPVYGTGMQNSYVNFSRTSPQSHHRISSALSDIEEVDTTPKGSRNHKPNALASSPTLREYGNASQLVDGKGHSRKLSDGSSSVHSDELENMKWPGFDSAGGADVESVVLEDEEERYTTFPKVADSDDSVNDDPWLGTRADEDDDEDLLSKRADMILANAKKRLNVLEGNLRGARHSLLATPAAPKTPPYSSAASFSRDRSNLGGPRPRQFSSSPMSPSNFGHSRMFSDSSPVPIMPVPPRLPLLQKRSSSALGSFAGGLSTLERTTSLRGVRSQEVMRESRLQTWMEEAPVRASIDSTRSVSQQNFHRSRTPSIESLQRPASSASDIRAQMDELKGRISTLKERAQEDRMKRLSINSLRTPSPFTAAEKWHSNSENYKSQPLGANAGAGWSPNSSPVAKQGGFQSPFQSQKADSNSDIKSSPPRHGDGEEYAESCYEDAEELLGDIKEEPEDPEEASTSTPSTTVHAESQKILIGPQDPGPDELGESVTPEHSSKQAFNEEYAEYEGSVDDESMDGHSEYHEAVPVLAERHEDRADAFDYEHFFLHSAMGTFSRGRRDSSSSEDSLETTRPASPAARPATAVLISDEPSLHRRSQSVESISTVASFATATEGMGSDSGSDDEGTDPLDMATEHYFPHPAAQLPNRPFRNSRRLDSAVHMDSDDHKFDLNSDAGYGSQTKQRPVSALVSSLLEIHNMVAGSDMPDSDMALVEGVIKSLQRTCISLQSLSADDYERRTIRRRLDAAQKALESE